MERANCDFWQSVNDFNLLDAGFLWCGFEPPPEIPLSENERKGRMRRIPVYGPSSQLKPPPLLPIVREKLNQFIRDIEAGKLRLRDYGANDLPVEITAFANGEFAITSTSVFDLMSVDVTRQDLKKYAQTMREAPEFLFSKKQHGLSIEQKEIIDKIGTEIERIYESLQAKNKGPGVGKQATATPENWRETALEGLRARDYKHMKPSHLPEGVFSTVNNISRDIKVKMIQGVLKEHNLPTGDPGEIIGYHRQQIGKNRKQTK